MTLADWIVLATVVLAIAAVGVAKQRGRAEYDNANPRDPQFYGEPFRRRALGAHQNSLEAVPFFVAAVLLAEFRHVPQGLTDGLAVGFFLARVAYVVAYLANRPTLRSLVWGVAFALNVALFTSSAWLRWAAG